MINNSNYLTIKSKSFYYDECVWVVTIYLMDIV